MPQLTDRFGPIPLSTVLDVNGNGTIPFQVNGSNARITNLFVKVSTSNNQAVCKMYRGPVSDSNLIQTTNSGSTGAAAQGSIDLVDGETLNVVWSGGDAGATAFLTLLGNTIPFDQIGSPNITWSDPIAAGDGSLVYPQIKSPDFAVGVSGWILRRDGSVEFGSAVIRGQFEAGGGNVRLNSNGLHIEGVGQQFDINGTAGWLARNDPDNGESTQITPDGYFVTPQDPSPLGTAVDFGSIQAGYANSGLANEQPYMTIGGVEYTGKAAPIITMYGQAANDAGADNTTNIVISNAKIIDIPDRLVNDATGMDISSTQLFDAIIGVAIGDTAVALGNTNYPFPMPTGRARKGFVNIANAGGNSSAWYARWLDVSDTQFNIIVYRPAAATAAVNLVINVAVFVI